MSQAHSSEGHVYKAPAEKWVFRFGTRPVQETYDSVTAMFLDCHDDQEIADELSGQRGGKITARDVRQIRLAASRAAREDESRQVKLKWIFRFRRVTPNTLVKEYMLLTDQPSFLRAKLALAEEIAMLMRAHGEEDLWIAVNEALGRNNVPLDVLKELVAYNDSNEKLTRLVKQSSWRKDMIDTGTRLRIFAQVVHLNQQEHGQDVKAARQWAAQQLGVDPGELTEGDMAFLVDYHGCSLIPESLDENELIKSVQQTDTVLQGDVFLAQAFDGNLGNLSKAEIETMVKTLKMRPLPDAVELRSLLDATEVQLRLGVADSPVLEALRDMVKVYLSLTDIKTFFSFSGLLGAKLRGVSRSDLSDMLAHLNSLPNQSLVEERLKELLQDPPYAEILSGFSRKYLTLRWGKTSLGNSSL